jgi:hypothetical protein
LIHAREKEPEQHVETRLILTREKVEFGAEDEGHEGEGSKDACTAEALLVFVGDGGRIFSRLNRKQSLFEMRRGGVRQHHRERLETSLMIERDCTNLERLPRTSREGEEGRENRPVFKDDEGEFLNVGSHGG